MTSDLKGHLTELFDVPVFTHSGNEYIPTKNIEDGLYWYIIVESFGCMIDLEDDLKQHFVGTVLMKPEHYMQCDPSEFDNCVIHGVICAFSRIVSSRVKWQVIDIENLKSLKREDKPITLENFKKNILVKMRSNRDATSTVSALTNQLLFGLIMICQMRGFYVAKTFNHYSPETGTNIKKNSFYVEFSIDGSDKHSHVHLPYQYWNRLEVPIIEHLSEKAVKDQPNLSVLLQRIDEEMETHIRPAIHLAEKVRKEKGKIDEKEIWPAAEKGHPSHKN